MSGGTFTDAQTNFIIGKVNEAGDKHSPKYKHKNVVVEALANSGEQMHLVVEVEAEDDKPVREEFGNSPAVPGWQNNDTAIGDMLDHCISEVEQHLSGVNVGSEEHDHDPLQQEADRRVEARVEAEKEAPEEDQEEPRRFGGTASAGGGRPSPAAMRKPAPHTTMAGPATAGSRATPSSSVARRKTAEARRKSSKKKS